MRETHKNTIVLPPNGNRDSATVAVDIGCRATKFARIDFRINAVNAIAKWNAYAWSNFKMLHSIPYTIDNTHVYLFYNKTSA